MLNAVIIVCRQFASIRSGRAESSGRRLRRVVHGFVRFAPLSVVLALALAAAASARVKVSHDDGHWSEVYWTPEGLPAAGDTIIIASHVYGMPSARFGKLTVKAGASLRVDTAMPLVAGLEVRGLLRLERSAGLDCAGNFINDGVVAGDGTVRMVLNGASVGGAGTFGHLAIASAPATAAYLSSSLAVPSLTLAAGTRLLARHHDLTVDGPCNAASADGDPAIIGAGGTLHLNGPVFGVVRGDVVLGYSARARPRRGRMHQVAGIIGDSTGSVRVAASRRLSMATLLGSVTLDSGAVLEGSGLANARTNTIVGSLTLARGAVLRSSEDDVRWAIRGDVFNDGTIERCTMILSGARVRLRSDRGVWDPSISLVYYGASGGELLLQSSLVVSSLTIGPLSPLDSNIALLAGPHTLRVRHSFTSDTARGCRIVSDTVVRLWGASAGQVDGAVAFEGFWGSSLRGSYGRNGRTVRFAVPKRAAAPLTATGIVESGSFATLTVAAPVRVDGAARMIASPLLEGGSRLVIEGDLQTERDVSGAGTIAFENGAGRLDARGIIAPGVAIEVGRDSVAATLSLARTLRAWNVTVFPGSAMTHRDGDSIVLSGDLSVKVRYAGGFNSAAPACDPNDPRAAQVFPGALSVLRYDAGYVAADTVHPGTGYYVRFPGAVTLSMTGRPIDLPKTIALVDGWNLIGAASVPIAVADVTVSGTTLLSGFLPVIGGGTAVSTLLPGNGYWVNAAGAGTMTLHAGN